MALPLNELEDMLDALKRARFSGVNRITFQDRTLSYASGAELDAAISKLEDEIAVASSTTRSRTTTIASASKGF